MQIAASAGGYIRIARQCRFLVHIWPWMAAYIIRVKLTVVTRTHHRAVHAPAELHSVGPPPGAKQH